MAEPAPQEAARFIARFAKPVIRSLTVKRLEYGLFALVCHQTTILYPGQQEDFVVNFEKIGDYPLFCHGSPVMVWLNKFEQVTLQPGLVLTATSSK